VMQLHHDKEVELCQNGRSDHGNTQPASLTVPCMASQG
jgi:hypothetical protein